jgi:F-type H+-transporting ATPase subunit b
VNRFLDRLTNAGDQTRDLLKKAEKDQGFVVVSSHDLTENEQDRIRAAIRDATTPHAAVEFHKNNDLVCGIELQAPGCKLAWSVRESLAELESDLIDAVSQHMPTQTARKMQESAP